MVLRKYTQEKSCCMIVEGEVTGPGGYELQLSGGGRRETWKGKVTYFGMLEMLGGTYFHQLRFFSREHPVMYLNFVLPRDNVLTEGGYAIGLVPYEESGDLHESVTEFYLPSREDGFPDPACDGYASIGLNRDGYALEGTLEAKVSNCLVKGSFWLHQWEGGLIRQLSTTIFT